MEDETDTVNVEPEPWVRIQQKTFTNWVNDKLRSHALNQGRAEHEVTLIEDIQYDFSDGVQLCALVSALKNVTRIGRVIAKKNLNHYEASGNLALALQNIEGDGVRLINIGGEDIASGNLKLILGMVWLLIRHYQIGSQSRLPPKKLMLHWVNAVLHPHLEIRNFSTDWNNGLALCGIIEYCRPGSFPNWYRLNKQSRLENCTAAIDIAERYLKIPTVVSAENLCSSDLDELSGMTYLSYFMMKNSPGYDVTREWVKVTIDKFTEQSGHPEIFVKDFDINWNDGLIASALVMSLGGRIQGWPDIDKDHQKACEIAITASYRQLMVRPIITGDEMAARDVNHIAVMAYAVWHQHAHLQADLDDLDDAKGHDPVAFLAPNGADDNNESSPPPSPTPTPPPREPTPPPTPPSAPTEPQPPVASPVTPPASVEDPLLYTITIDDVPVQIIRSWRIHATQTIKISSNEVRKHGFRIEAMSPSRELKVLNMFRVDESTFHTDFCPTEKGCWKIDVFYNDQKIKYSPFYVNVYDVSLINVARSHDGSVQLDDLVVFDVDCLQVGNSDLNCYVFKNGRSHPHKMMATGIDQYKITFTPKENAKYLVHIYCGGVEIENSPFALEALDMRQVYCSGEGMKTGLLGCRSSFAIDASSCPGNEPHITIDSPSGANVSFDVSKESDIRFIVSYVPNELGVHTITADYGNKAVVGSPFEVNVREPRVYVTDLQKYAHQNVDAKFRIDASEMNQGTIEIDSDLPVRNYERIDSNVYVVTIVPRKTGMHDIIIKYNDRNVKGSPYQVFVRENLDTIHRLSSRQYSRES